MSYGLNVEMHKQTEICKRLDAIIRQVLPFLNGEHQQQVAVAVERAKQITMTELTALMQVKTEAQPLLDSANRLYCRPQEAQEDYPEPRPVCQEPQQDFPQVCPEFPACPASRPPLLRVCSAWPDTRASRACRPPASPS